MEPPASPWLAHALQYGSLGERNTAQMEHFSLHCRQFSWPSLELSPFLNEPEIPLLCDPKGAQWPELPGTCMGITALRPYLCQGHQERCPYRLAATCGCAGLPPVGRRGLWGEDPDLGCSLKDVGCEACHSLHWRCPCLAWGGTASFSFLFTLVPKILSFGFSAEQATCPS